MKAIIKKSVDGMNKVVDYVKEINTDRYGSASSKRWMAWMTWLVLTFVAVYILLNHKDYDVWIVLILCSTLLALISLLMGFSAFGEKVVTTIGKVFGGTGERVINSSHQKSNTDEGDVVFTEKDFEPEVNKE